MYHIFITELELKGEYFPIYYGEYLQYKKLIDEAKRKNEITPLLPTD